MLYKVVHLLNALLGEGWGCESLLRSFVLRVDSFVKDITKAGKKSDGALNNFIQFYMECNNNLDPSRHPKN